MQEIEILKEISKDSKMGMEIYQLETLVESVVTW